MKIGKKKYRIREFSPLWHAQMIGTIILGALSIYVWAVLFTSVLG